MYGWRARIGLLIPSLHTVAELEFHRLAPEGVSVHTERMMHIWEKEEGLEKAVTMMNEDMSRAAASVATANPDIIVYSCTGGSLYKGIGYDEKLSQEITEKTGIPAITTSTAVLTALRRLKIKKIVVATPYVEALNKIEKSFLEGNGFEILEIKGLEILPAVAIGDRYPEEAYRLAKSIDTPEAEGIFISCADFRTIEIIDKLESDVKKPVISSNQATAWLALRKLGISESIEGYGKLLTLDLS